MAVVRRETKAGAGFLAVLATVLAATLSSAQDPIGGPPGNGPGRGGNGNANRNGQNGSPQNNQQNNARQSNASPVEQLGRAIFFDTNLSNPPGMSCASCHAPEAGFTYPDSSVNQKYGSVPGVTRDRFGSRKPMTITYAWFAPDGPTFQRGRRGSWTGGFFSDGRANSLSEQVAQPLTNPNEMDNTLHGLASPDMVVKKVAGGNYAGLFKQVNGDDAFTKSSDDVFRMIRKAAAAFEQSREVSPFSSKYDAVAAGEASFTQSELNGLRLFTGTVTGRPGGDANYKDARCVSCHTISQDDRRDFFTNWTYANIGVPKNARNPYYKQTKSKTNPQGFNPDGDRYIDLGLGAILYPQRGLPPGNIGPGSDGRGDFLHANGEFRVASLRNVDKRPSPSFVKAYMHNGVFKSLKEVVHFYNTRNLTARGDVLDLTAAAATPDPKNKPLWPPPEYPSEETLQNPTGRTASQRARVGNLGLTAKEEDDIVAFLQTLSDGYFTPAQRRRPPQN